MELISYAFDSRCQFKFKKCKFKFEGLEFVLYPGDTNNCEVIQVIIEDSSKREETYQSINRFLNSFGWINNCSFEYKGYCAFGQGKEIDLMKIGPRFSAPRNDRSLVVNFKSIVMITSNELEVALSLYNEAKFTQNVFYKFFSFWKILDIKYPNRPTNNATDFINQMIREGKVYLDRFITDLLSKKIDVGKHLYNNFRCAIAHITREQVKLSLDEEDFREVSGACNSIEHFVKFFIESELKLTKHCDNINVLEFEK